MALYFNAFLSSNQLQAVTVAKSCTRLDWVVGNWLVYPFYRCSYRLPGIDGAVFPRHVSSARVSEQKREYSYVYPNAFAPPQKKAQQVIGTKRTKRLLRGLDKNLVLLMPDSLYSETTMILVGELLLPPVCIVLELSRLPASLFRFIFLKYANRESRRLEWSMQ